MKIICLIRHLKMGGAERQLSGLAITLHQLGHDVQVLTYHEGDFFDGILAAHGVPHVIVPKGGLSAVSIIRLSRYFKREKPDLVIAFAAGAGRKACLARMLGGPFRLWVSERNANPRKMPFDAYRMWLYGLAADRIICNSHSQEAFLRAHFPRRAGQLCTVVNFIDTQAFLPPALPPENPVFTVVTTARVCARKNVLGFIEAVRRLQAEGRTLRVYWYGRNRDSRYLRRCEKAIREHGLQACFFLRPSQRDVTALYGSADAFCLPSFYEGTSNSLAEALCCGLPVLCSDVSDNARYVRPGESGFLVNPHDPASLAQALRQAMDLTPSARYQLGRQGRAIVLEALSPERFRDSYDALLREDFPAGC